MFSSLFLMALAAQTAFAYTWQQVKIGGGGGFVPGIVFNTGTKGVAYARTDIGGLYRLNPEDDSWIPLTDYANNTNWGDWGIEAVATDPTDPARVYAAVGMYTNNWDPHKGAIISSKDKGATWTRVPLDFKNGGNMPGRGMGERLAVDPQNNKIIYFGARSGNGLWKSTDQGASFKKVDSFTAVGTYVQKADDSSGYQSDIQGLAFVTFDEGSKLADGVSSRIFVGTAVLNDSSIYVTEDGGATWKAIEGQPTGYLPHKGKFSKAENALYVSYSNSSGPYDQADGSVWRWDGASGKWSDITPKWKADNKLSFGFGGLSLDAQVPGTLIVAACNLWWPDVQIFRSNDSGTSWTTIWDFNNNHWSDNSIPIEQKTYTLDFDKAPWINTTITDDKVLGWMVEALEIDPFDSDHWLWGTGETIFGGHDLTKWPAVHVSSLADGVEETAVTALSVPPGKALLAGVGDDGGFTYDTFDDLKTSPKTSWLNPLVSSTAGVDYAGKSPKMVVRTGQGSGNLLAVSTDGGSTWAPHPLASKSQYGGVVAFGADGDAIVFAAGTGGSSRFTVGAAAVGNGSSNGTVSTLDTLPKVTTLASDKQNGKYFYAADATKFYVSSDGGVTFSSSSITGSGKSIAVNPGKEGDIWLSTSSGLFHSTDFGATFAQISGVDGGSALAVGKGSGTYPNVYGFLNIGGETALRMSSDTGATWTTIQDAAHGFGASDNCFLGASTETAGLVFVGTNGRGVFYGTASP